jgi:hypothetical protein
MKRAKQKAQKRRPSLKSIPRKTMNTKERPQLWKRP